METPLPDALSLTAYCLFSGVIDQSGVQRFFERFALLSQSRIMAAHLLMQSNGGVVSDGIALYNFLRTAPLDITVYNSGIVASIGVIAYLGAAKRVASPHAAFMIHKTQTPVGATTTSIAGIAKSLDTLDMATDAVLREHLSLTPEQWETHRTGDLWFSAGEALTANICTEIGDFSPPKGSLLTYV